MPKAYYTWGISTLEHLQPTLCLCPWPIKPAHIYSWNRSGAVPADVLIHVMKPHILGTALAKSGWDQGPRNLGRAQTLWADRIKMLDTSRKPQTGLGTQEKHQACWESKLRMIESLTSGQSLGHVIKILATCRKPQTGIKNLRHAQNTLDLGTASCTQDNSKKSYLWRSRTFWCGVIYVMFLPQTHSSLRYLSWPDTDATTIKLLM